MILRITIDLSGKWVLSHKDDDILPIAALKAEAVKGAFGAAVVEEQSFTSLTFTVDTRVAAEKIETKILKLFAKLYPKTESGVITVTVEAEDGGDRDDDIGAEEKSANPSENSADAEKDDTPSDSADAEKSENRAPRSCADTDRLRSALERIDALIGGAEFKKLAHEIATVVPEIKRNNAFDIFSYQSYLFSISEGYGLSTYLKCLAELFDETGVKAFSSAKVTELKLPPFKDDAEAFAEARREISSGGDRLRLICIDISEWIDNTDNRNFKDFLLETERHLDEFIVVFRIPFVDKDVLDRVTSSLGDLIYVRAVAFPPLDRAQLRAVAEADIAKYGFTVSKSAWEFFHRRLAEERSDGKFYGLKTVKKVVRELLYRKQLENAKKRAQCSVIKKADMRELCAPDGGKMTGMEMLDKLVGCESVKSRLREIVAQIEFSKKSERLGMPCIHMRFVGNPGTGKTTVARILGKILKERGVLSVGNFYEYSGRDFCGRYVGETAPKTTGICRDAYGSVLFIDEAYSLYRSDDNDRDYGREALDTLIAEMENHRSDFVVIMAGYTDEMKLLMKGNSGLESRMPYIIEFPNFTREQLCEIYEKMAREKFECEDGLFDDVRAYFARLSDETVAAKTFANARYVRNLFERTWAKAALRCQLGGKNDVCLTRDDFARAVGDREFSAAPTAVRPRIGFKNGGDR